MAVTEDRKRPVKQFEVIVAYGPYRKGDKIQPTGMYRDVLKSRGLIREVVDDAVRDAEPLPNRMVPDPQQDLQLATRGKRVR